MDSTIQMLSLVVNILSSAASCCTLILAFVLWVMFALSLFIIAKRRGIPAPWLAWFPLGDLWILGAISDQYQEEVYGRLMGRRKVLLGWEIALYISCLCLLIYASVWTVSITMFGYTQIAAQSYNGGTVFLVAALFMGFLLVLMMLVAYIMRVVIFYEALYDLFRSCDPKHSVLFLVLSILGNFLLAGGFHSIFTLVCAKKDLGMPEEEPDFFEE